MPQSTLSPGLAFGGIADFGDCRLEVQAIATSAAGVSTAVMEDPDFRLDVGGLWDDL